MFSWNSPAWLHKKVFLLENGQWAAFILLLFLGFVGAQIVKYYIERILKKFLSNEIKSLNRFHKRHSTRPFALMALSFTFLISLPFFELAKETHKVVQVSLQILFTLSSVWGSWFILDLLSLYFEKLAAISENKFDDVLVPLLRKTLKALSTILGLLFICQTFNWDITHLVTGLGIGGLAFALAAKDTISNIFGSLTVILDRPFQMGDWVVIGSKNIEGTVIEVGLRSTRIRTFYDSIITVPNSILTSIEVDNFGRRTYRRLSTHIDIEYGTPVEKIEAFCLGIRLLIKNHRYTRKDVYHVYLNQMGANSLRIMLYVFWKVPDWSTELAERHNLLLDIIKLAKKLDVQFAFPTQTLHMYKEDPKALEEIPPEYCKWGESTADEILKESPSKGS